MRAARPARARPFWRGRTRFRWGAVAYVPYLSADGAAAQLDTMPTTRPGVRPLGELVRGDIDGDSTQSSAEPASGHDQLWAGRCCRWATPPAAAWGRRGTVVKAGAFGTKIPGGDVDAGAAGTRRRTTDC
ncbi:hypothetical protein [Nonomuraea polychroma]|uniref:hypothetical protein n=1 Tax=Nonomuraea polychroma TaxID=46176 RepID=UPI000FDEFECC|nr:hypothetical protein [Nonomuraea polychroma]